MRKREYINMLDVVVVAIVAMVAVGVLVSKDRGKMNIRRERRELQSSDWRLYTGRRKRVASIIGRENNGTMLGKGPMVTREGLSKF